MIENFFMGQERRTEERLSYHAPCRYEIGSDESPSAILESGTSFIKNISLGGMLIEMLKSVTLNSRLDLEVMLPTASYPVRVQARVVWVEELEEKKSRYNIGMCFTEISSKDKEKISSLKKKIRNKDL